MMPYTQEQIEKAIKQLSDYIERMKPISDSGGLPATTMLNKDIAIILAALEAAQKERDGQWERIQKEFEPLRTTLENADDEILRLSHKITDIEKEYSEYEESQRVRMITILHTIGGLVEGRPTIELNYLQRLRELVRIEAYAAKLEKAGDSMKQSYSWINGTSCAAWDAARKEKP